VDHITKKDYQYVLADLIVKHPSGKVLMTSVPAHGEGFDVRMPADITPEELVYVVKDLLEFFYRHNIGVQKDLYDRGWTHAQIAELFFPGVPRRKEVPRGQPLKSVDP